MARRPRLDRELERYLVGGETVIVAVRRHWFHLIREIAMAVAATVLAFWVDLEVPRTPGGEVLHNLALAIWWAAALWLLWRFLNWRHDWFVATDKRFLLFYGFIRRKVAMMPLMRVTDMTFDRSVLGRIVGYGMFVLESAGQKQALSVIDHVPDADRHYRAICTQLFGPGSQVRVIPGFTPPPPEDDGTGGDDGPGPDGPAPVGGPSGDAVPVPYEDASATTVHEPESWYRSSNVRGSNRLGDTGEIPVVRVPRHDDEDAPLYPPRHWAQ
ncbi:PH domain-containing protein [Oryzobacter telluris]|uniref:PH domain-containing protein n=1 Tax=Oryzobacter telluris TaxID=3149179 RepID=UPI00370D540D